MTDDDINRALAYAIADTLTALLQPMSLGDALAARAKQPPELDKEDRARIGEAINALRAGFILANNAGRHDLVGQFFEAYRALMKVLEPAKSIPPLEQCWDARWAPKVGWQECY